MAQDRARSGLGWSAVAGLLGTRRGVAGESAARAAFDTMHAGDVLRSVVNR